MSRGHVPSFFQPNLQPDPTRSHRRRANVLPGTPFRFIRTEMKTVAVIGASNDRGKIGNKAVCAFLQQGFSVYPVNLHEAEVEGLPAFKNIRDIPVRPFMISVYVPPKVLLN